MCFNFGASVSAFVAATLTIVVTFIALLYQEPRDSEFQMVDLVVALLFIGFMFSVACMQIVDAVAHRSHNQGKSHDNWSYAGVAGYCLTGLQPSMIAFIAAYLFGSESDSTIWAGLSIGVGTIAALHVVLCISWDAPVDRWLKVTIEHIDTNSWFGKICAVTYNFFNPSANYDNDSKIYGSSARYWVYIITLPVSIVLLDYAVLDRANSESLSDGERRYAVHSAIAVWSFFVISMAGVFVAMGLEQVVGHFGSVWCLVSNSGTLVACAALLWAVDVTAAVWTVAGSLVVWALVFLGFTVVM